MTKRSLAILAVFFVAIGCGSSSGPAAGSSATPTPTPTQEPCIEPSLVASFTDPASSHIDKAVALIRKFDIDGGVEHLRLAASEVRGLADAVRPIDLGSADKLLRSADEVDKAATALHNVDIDQMGSYLAQGTNDLKIATDTLHEIQC